LSDDHAATALGCAGHPWLETPNLDRIAREGVLFENAFVTTSLCSPSRASFLSGQMARQHGVAINKQTLHPSLPTFATALQAAGYDTGYFGKWHLGELPGGRYPGFRRWAGFPGQGRYQDPVFTVDGQEVATQGHADDRITDFALEFLREPRSAPFLAVVSFKGPHGPLTPAERFQDLYADRHFEVPPNVGALPPFPRRKELMRLAREAGEPWTSFSPPEGWADGRERAAYEGDSDEFGFETTMGYFRLIAGVDENVGRILEALDERGAAEDTLVVFAGDNGLHLGDHGLGTKCTAYEASMRIPLLLRYPRLGLHGVRRSSLVLNVDLAPTVLDLAGVPVPSSMAGLSWRPLLREGPEPVLREDFVYEYYRLPTLPVPTIVALRTRTEKLITYPGYPTWTELYDLVRDPGETANLAGEAAHADERRALEARLAELETGLGPRIDR